MRYTDPYYTGGDYSRYGHATSQFPQFDDPSRAAYAYPTQAPPRYSEIVGRAPTVERPWYDVRGWSLRKKLIVAGCVVVIIVAVIVGAVEGTKAAAYPNYSALNYTLKDTYSGSSFFDNFEYATSDPTNGFVQYVDSQTASQMNLTYASESSAVIKVDTDTQNQTSGRKSVRITSTNTYESGLFIFDVVHTPYGCATWPALWLTDPSNWPENGEIDVIESNNNGTNGNSMTLHTSSGCKMNVRRKETGSAQVKKATYGGAFNDNGGGVYAMELRDAGIRIWMFTRDNVPSDISNSSSTPDPSTWGEALADFPSTNCDISSHFRNQSIVANIDICGDLAGADSYYKDMYSCPGSCKQYAAENGAAFGDAYWEFNSFKVYSAS
ncbi:hypothetical protein N7532_006892 [Penicillium argentinense]|uniref:GH16 domain-containing protein n=1 Tax=Penicillium argentinense TaxID=1131581 RepID=A0A9W9FGU4_9EURO|nr:uncharacterized protein N7532_006892 [Penicillium argentinense]KAJ5099891.1 hypothetical protein N7532_006892 [Penicillium argentinense]